MPPRDAFDRILADLGRFSGAARVGALDEENALKLSYAEFGTTRGVPPRPTLSVTTDRLRRPIERAIDRQVGAVLDGRGRGTTGQEIMADVGRDLAEATQDAIDGDTPPPLAPSTAATRRREGKDTRTLVDEGDMLRSIQVEASADPRAWENDDDG